MSARVSLVRSCSLTPNLGSSSLGTKAKTEFGNPCATESEELGTVHRLTKTIYSHVTM